MATTIACAVVRDDPPQVFVAEDQETLNWVLALKLVAATPSAEVDPGHCDRLREALREERWGDAVALWMADHPEVDVYPSVTLYESDDVALGPQELEFTPLFRG